MYNKRQIIEEIRRVAELLGTKSLKKKDFLKNTMIPLSTINFYISSWNEVLSEAGLEDGQAKSNIKTKDLLNDLLRIKSESGGTPTFALVEKIGKYSKEDYQKKWRNLDDAYRLAEKKYGNKSSAASDKTIIMSGNTDEIVSPDKTIMATAHDSENKDFSVDMEDTFISIKKEDIDLEETTDPNSGEFSDNFSSDNILTIEKMENKGKKKEKNEKDEIMSEPSFDYLSGDSGIENLNAIDISKPKKKKIIPKTIKPVNDKKDNGKGEELNFRGIKRSPVDTRGVIYIFGLVSEELNFIIETFGSGRSGFFGKRNLSIEEEKWEKVKIGFALNSYDLKDSRKLTNSWDLLVCWKHDWEDCSLEVLELSSTLKILENY